MAWDLNFEYELLCQWVEHAGGYFKPLKQYGPRNVHGNNSY